VPQLALDQDDLEQYIGVLSMVVDLTYDADAGEVRACNPISVGLYEVF
jgi:hypothetical protein